MRHISTVKQTRMLNYMWLSVDRRVTDLPVGVLTGLSIVSETGRAIDIRRVVVVDGKLSFTLSIGDETFAHVTTDKEMSLVEMTPGKGCVSAYIRTGVFKESSVAFEPNEPVRVRGSLIAVSSTVAVDPQLVTANAVSVEWSKSARLNLGQSYLTYYHDPDTKAVTIQLTEEARLLFRPVSPDAVVWDSRIMTSIRNVRPGVAGEIAITLTYGGQTVPVLQHTPSLAVISNTTQTIVERCDADTYIDDRLSPAVNRDYTYLPLDDAYLQVGNRFVREYRRLEALTYAEYVGGLSLYERNQYHDKQ